MKTYLVLLLLLGLCAFSTQVCDREIREQDTYGGSAVGNLLTVQTAQTCQNKCTENARCVYFIFARGYCQMRSGPVQGSYPYPGIWSGFSLRDCTSPARPASKCGPQRSVNMEKMAYKTLHSIPTVQACEERCNQDTSCDFYVYFSDKWTADFRKQYCFLKSGQPTKVSTYPGIISGYADRACK